jgi:hypothetical protein
MHVGNFFSSIVLWYQIIIRVRADCVAADGIVQKGLCEKKVLPPNVRFRNRYMRRQFSFLDGYYTACAESITLARFFYIGKKKPIKVRIVLTKDTAMRKKSK